MDDVLPMLLGAALVSTGVLASALADRIRGLRTSMQREARGPREVPVRRELAEPAERVESRVKGLTMDGWRPLAGTPAQGVSATPATPVTTTTGSDDVVAALVGAGYRKAVATKAVFACTAPEQASPELWTAAALRRAMGGAS